MGIASFILGIIALGMMLLIFVFKISFGSAPSLCAIVGLILGIIQYKKDKDRNAKKGIILAIIYIVIFIIVTIVGLFIIKNTIFEPMKKYATENNSVTQEKSNLQEREKVELAALLAFVSKGENEPVSYSILNTELQKQFGASEYTLTGPDVYGNFTLKINSRTYTIDKNCKVAK